MLRNLRLPNLPVVNSTFVAAIFFAALLAPEWAAMAHTAALGEHMPQENTNEQSTNEENAKSRRLVGQTQHLRVYESRQGGNLVKQYVGSDGVICAVSWSGMASPDLKELLGTSYFDEYSEALKSVPVSKSSPGAQSEAKSQTTKSQAMKLQAAEFQAIKYRARSEGHRELSSRRLVIRRSGHMRNLRGRILDPALCPGVKVDEIQ
jgi:hypothetical protein